MIPAPRRCTLCGLYNLVGHPIIVCPYGHFGCPMVDKTARLQMILGVVVLSTALVGLLTSALFFGISVLTVEFTR